jgi:hypothetical protein
MRVANTMELRISRLAASTTSSAVARRSGREVRVLAQAPDHVLDVDHGVVDQLADRDRHAAERHRVQASRRRPRG